MVSTAGLPPAKRHCGGVSGVSGVSGETPKTHAVTPHAAGTSQQDGSKMVGGKRGNQGGVETYQRRGGSGGGSGSGSGSGMMVSGGRNDGIYYKSLRVDLQMQLGGVTHLSHPNHPLNDNIRSYQRSPETIQNLTTSTGGPRAAHVLVSPTCNDSSRIAERPELIAFHLHVGHGVLRATASRAFPAAAAAAAAPPCSIQTHM